MLKYINAIFKSYKIYTLNLGSYTKSIYEYTVKLYKLIN